MEQLPEDLFHALAHYLPPIELHLLALSKHLDKYLRAHWRKLFYEMPNQILDLKCCGIAFQYFISNEPMQAYWRALFCRRLLSWVIDYETDLGSSNVLMLDKEHPLPPILNPKVLSARIDPFPGYSLDDHILGIDGIIYNIRIKTKGNVVTVNMVNRRLVYQINNVPLIRRIIPTKTQMLIGVDISNTQIFVLEPTFQHWDHPLQLNGILIQMLKETNRNVVALATNYRKDNKYQCFYYDLSLAPYDCPWREFWPDREEFDYELVVTDSGCHSTKRQRGPHCSYWSHYSYRSRWTP